MSTIAAIATPPGSGGVGVIRISGPDAPRILADLVEPGSPGFSGFKARFLHHGWIRDGKGGRIDECLAVHMPGPATFTGEDVAEIHCHASPLIVQWILERCLELGARQAERGEFSRRAFLNGRMDLSQAEAVAELIAAPGREALRYSMDRLSGQLSARIRSLQAGLNDLSAQALVCLDFPDDELPNLSRADFIERVTLAIADMDELLRNARRASILQQGSRILLVGPVNAGKSSLLNTLAGHKRALVSEMPGTTRDYLEESLNFEGLPVRLLDTAGLREKDQAGPVEALGIEQSLALLKEADLIWLVMDASRASSSLERILPDIKSGCCGQSIILVLNKSDLPAHADWEKPDWKEPFCRVSAITGSGLDELVRLSRSLLFGGEKSEGHGLAPNARQTWELQKAREELLTLKRDLEEGQNYDASLSSLDSASAILDNILGLDSHDELLDKIFSQFCIGK